jgi:hypothetical protein
MPKSTRAGAARREELPSTIARSDRKAQRTFAQAHDSAADSYGEGERAHRTAFAALKRSHEKVGDHWEPKEHNGPSDARAAEGGRDSSQPSKGGVDANSSKAHLLEVAGRLEVRGRSRMTKSQLVDAIQRANSLQTARARGAAPGRRSVSAPGSSGT